MPITLVNHGTTPGDGTGDTAFDAFTKVNDSLTYLDTALGGKAASSHTHTTTDITNLSSYTGLDARYYTETEVDTLLAAKQATLVSGTNIKTINGSSILGSGDLTVSGGGGGTWGSITGTLTDQTDLATALSGKAASSHTHGTADITNLSSYTGFDARYYTESEVDTLVGAKLNSSAASAFGLTLVDDADAAAARTTLGLGTAATQASSAFEVPLTFGTGLTRSTNTITVNTTQNIAKLSNLTSNGFVKTSGGDGTLSVDTTSYQASLVSGTNIKTINGSSILGSGDLTVSGGSGLTHPQILARSLRA